MANKNRSVAIHKKGLRTTTLLPLVIFLIVGIPFLLINYQAKQKGMSIGEVMNGKLTGKK